MYMIFIIYMYLRQVTFCKFLFHQRLIRLILIRLNYNFANSHLANSQFAQFFHLVLSVT